jgi:hypothetical protein
MRKRSVVPAMRAVMTGRRTRSDLNTIEQVFSKLKALLRKATERTIPRLWRRIRSILRTVTKKEPGNVQCVGGLLRLPQWPDWCAAAIRASDHNSTSTRYDRRCNVV